MSTSNEPIHKIGLMRESENRLVGLVKHSRYYLPYAVCVNSSDQRRLIDNGIRTKRAAFYVTKLIRLASCEDSDQPWHPTGILAHLSRRLIGELIGYSWSGVRPSVVVRRRRPRFQTSSSLKPLARSKPNFMWSLLG